MRPFGRATAGKPRSASLSGQVLHVNVGKRGAVSSPGGMPLTPISSPIAAVHGSPYPDAPPASVTGGDHGCGQGHVMHDGGQVGAIDRGCSLGCGSDYTDAAISEFDFSCIPADEHPSAVWAHLRQGRVTANKLGDAESDGEDSTDSERGSDGSGADMYLDTVADELHVAPNETGFAHNTDGRQPEPMHALPMFCNAVTQLEMAYDRAKRRAGLSLIHI